MKKTKLQYVLLFICAAVLIYIFVFLLPTIILSVTSLTKWNGANTPVFVGFGNYSGLLQDGTFKRALTNTTAMGLLAAFVNVPMGVALALILNRKPGGWKLIRSVSLLPDIIASSVKAVIFIFIFNPGMGLLNGIIRALGFSNFNVNWFFDERTAFLAINLTWIFQLGFVVLVCLGELLSMPPSYREAARIDGASDLQIDFLINIPLIRNIIGTSVIVMVTSIFKMFEQIYLTTVGGPGEATTTLALLIYQNITNDFQYGYANAIGMVLLFLGIMVILIVQKAFRMNKSLYE